MDMLAPCAQQEPAPSELDLLRRWRERGDNLALQSLMARHMNKLRAWARRGGPAHFEDLLAEGIVAFVDAAKRFDPDQSEGVAGHILPSVRGAIFRELARLQSAVTIPERQVRDAFSGRMVGERAEMIRQALAVESLDDIELTQSAPPTEEIALMSEKHRILRRAVAGALRRLARDERRLVVHHLLHEDMALDTLADRMDLTVSRARMIEGRALHKMRNTLMSKGFLVSDLT